MKTGQETRLYLDKTSASLSFFLKDQSRTVYLGQKLADYFMHMGKYPVLLFAGPLGAGKTTMIRGIVQSLPGGRYAEVSSPSFNILNIYPTSPETAHFDLYRLEGGDLDPESEEILFDESRLVLVEWSQHLPEDFRPADSMKIILSFEGRGRKAQIVAGDEQLGEKLFRSLQLSCMES